MCATYGSERLPMGRSLCENHPYDRSVLRAGISPKTFWPILFTSTCSSRGDARNGPSMILSGLRERLFQPS